MTPSLPSEMGRAPRPLWRWWLFCVCLWLWFRFHWEWALNLMGRCVLADWIANVDEISAQIDRMEVPF